MKIDKRKKISPKRQLRQHQSIMWLDGGSLAHACNYYGKRMGASLGLTLRYALFACLAIIVNIASQAVALRLYEGSCKLIVAMALGTGAGLVTKYVFDKHWIFNDFSRGVAAHARKFSLYASTGLVTTALFWGTEYLFDGLTPGGRWRLPGAVIGLSLGYMIKYFLDRHFVFSTVKG